MKIEHLMKNFEKKWNSFFDLQDKEKQTFGEIMVFLIKSILAVPVFFLLVNFISLLGAMLQILF